MSAHRVLYDLFRAPYLMTDPGASGTITVNRQMAVVPVVTAAAEARTLAQPTKAGLVCTVLIDTYVGALMLTVTGGYNQAASTSITMGTAGDWVTFLSVKVGSSHYWRVLGSEGTTLVETVTLTTISVGSQANTSGSGIPLSSSSTGAVQVYSDDVGANIADSVRGLRSRLLLTIDQSAGSIRALQGQLKLLDLIDVTTGIYTAVQGYVELVGTHIAKTGATFSCIDASLEIATALTVDSGGEAYGLHVETTGAGTITNNGTCAGIGITKASGAASWPVGIQVNCDSVIRGIQVGTLGSNITSGVPILNASSINGFYSDDNGADQTIGVYRNVTARTYFSVNQTVASADYHVLRGHLKAASGVNLGGDAAVRSAVNGYAELAGATTVGSGAFLASVFGEIWTDGNLVGTGKIAGVMSRFYSSTGTASGIVAAFMATKQWASTQGWLYGLYIDAATCDIRLANASGAGIYSKATSPNAAMTAPKGSLCLVPSGSGVNDRLWINTDGGTTWTFITAGA